MVVFGVSTPTIFSLTQAGKLAMERGWAINIGGGFHHCSAHRGGGFCAYADITLTIRFLFNRVPNVKKAMIIDLDAHQVGCWCLTHWDLVTHMRL